MSLVEAMIAIGVISAVSLTIATQLNNMFRGSAEVRLRVDAMDLNNELQEVVAVPSLCLSNFAGHTWPPAPTATGPGAISVQDVAIFNGAVKTKIIAKVNQLYGGLNITKIQVEPYATISPTSYLARISVEATSSAGLVPNRKPLAIPIQITTDAASNLIGCSGFATTNTAGSACAAIGGTYNVATAQCDLSALLNQSLASVGSCGAGMVLNGFNASGAPICVPAASGNPPPPPPGPAPACYALTCYTANGHEEMKTYSPVPDNVIKVPMSSIANDWGSGNWLVFKLSTGSQLSGTACHTNFWAHKMALEPLCPGVWALTDGLFDSKVCPAIATQLVTVLVSNNYNTADATCMNIDNTAFSWGAQRGMVDCAVIPMTTACP